jgi:hypothetical protein
MELAMEWLKNRTIFRFATVGVFIGMILFSLGIWLEFTQKHLPIAPWAFFYIHRTNHMMVVEAINYGRPPIQHKPNESVSGLLEDFAFYLSSNEHRKSKPTDPTEAWQRVYKRHQDRKR